MDKEVSQRLSREDWIRGALDLLAMNGIESVKIVPLAERLGVTSGSFYWHFKNRQALRDALLEHWVREMTDAAIEAARKFEGPPLERIWQLMNQVMSTGMARFDLAIWHWAQSDPAVQAVFQETLQKRFAFAAWMFTQAGFSAPQAEARSRLMVVYMMGESTLIHDAPVKRKKLLKLKFDILTSP